jgi:hypothetical protein
MEMSVRTRIAVDIVTEAPIPGRDLSKILQNAGSLVNHVATADTPGVKPLMIDQIVTSQHIHNGYDSMCEACVKGLSQDRLK